MWELRCDLHRRGNLRELALCPKVELCAQPGSYSYFKEVLLFKLHCKTSLGWPAEGLFFAAGCQNWFRSSGVTSTLPEFIPLLGGTSGKVVLISVVLQVFQMAVVCLNQTLVVIARIAQLIDLLFLLPFQVSFIVPARSWPSML